MAFNLKHRWLNENSFGWKAGLYIYAETIKVPDVNAEVAKDKNADAAKTPEKPLEPTVFKEKYEAAKAFLEKNVDKSDAKQEALHKLLLSTISEDFSKIENEYKGKVKELGKEDAEKQFKEKYDAEAEKLAHAVEHRVLEKMALNPDSFTKEKADGLKTNLVNHYLEGQGYENSKEFAKYLLDSGALPTSIDEKNFDKQIEAKLTPEVVNNAVKKLTEDLKKTITSSNEENNYIKTILGKPEMTEIVGSTRFDKASEAIAAQFHIEFDKEGKPLFAVDTINDKVISEKELESKIGDLCKEALSSKDKIDTYLEKVIKPKTEKDQALFKKVTEGNTFLNLGKIDEMSDIKGNKDLQVLLYQVNTINKARSEAEAELTKATEAMKPTAVATPEVAAAPAPEAEKKEEAPSNKEGNEAEEKRTEAPMDEKTKEKTEFIKTNQAELVKKLFEATGFKVDGEISPQMNEVATELLSKLDQPKLAAALNGRVTLTPEEVKGMREALISKLNLPNEKIEAGEQDLVMELGKAGGKPDYLNGLDLGNGTALNEMIARKFSITKDNTGKILVDNGTLDNAAWEKMFPKPAEGKPAIDPKTLEETAKNDVKARKMMEAMTNTLQQAEGPKKMGALESLTALLQLYGSLMAALKSGDYATLNDALKDFKEGKNPADSMKESKKNYTEALAKPDLPVDQLLSAYLEPRGEVANKLFVNEATPADKKESLGRYRNEAKPEIAIKLRDGMGLNSIDTITQVGDRTIVDAFKDGKRISVEFHTKDGRQVAEVKQYNKDITEEVTEKKDGKDVVTKKVTGKAKEDEGKLIVSGESGLTLANIKEQIPSLIKAAESTTEPPKEVAAETKPAAKAEEDKAAKTEVKSAVDQKKPDKKEVAKK